VIHEESSAPCAHPSAEDRDGTVEAHYSGLERLRPHACTGGRVFVGYGLGALPIRDRTRRVRGGLPPLSRGLRAALLRGVR
jgi:hypothetical protein